VAQSEGTLLALLRVSARDPKYVAPDGTPMALVNLATNVVFPAQPVELWINGTSELDAAAPQVGADQVLPLPSTIVLRMGSGAVGVTLLDAGGLECPAADGSIQSMSSPVVHLKPLAAATSSQGATGRFVVYHATTLPTDTSTLTNCFARVALVMSATSCSTATCAADLGTALGSAAAAAAMTWNTTTGDWDVRAKVASGPELHVHRTLGSKAAVLAREVDGVAVAFAPLEVNGTPVLLGP
jgi:hypothetical protein